MKAPTLSPVILVADDDHEDRDLLRHAMIVARLPTDCVRVVENGHELLDYLRRAGAYAHDRGLSPTPALILLDLRMPDGDGFSALEAIRADSALRTLPIVVMSTSDDMTDVQRSYELGANSYLTKPSSFASLVSAVETLRDYWFACVSLPERV